MKRELIIKVGSNIQTLNGLQPQAGNLSYAPGEFAFVFDGFVIGQRRRNNKPLPPPPVNCTKAPAGGNYIIAYTDGTYEVRDKDAKIIKTAAFQNWPAALLQSAYAQFAYSANGVFVLLVCTDGSSSTEYTCIDLLTGDQLWQTTDYYQYNAYGFYLEVVALDDIQWGGIWPDFDANTVVRHCYKNNVLVTNDIMPITATNIPGNFASVKSTYDADHAVAVDKEYHKRIARGTRGEPAVFTPAKKWWHLTWG